MLATTYTIQETTPRYLIQDRPLEESAGYRLQHQGPEVLSVNELLHVALDQPDISGEFVSGYGIRHLKTLTTVESASEELGIDQSVAARLLAVLEIGKRLYEPSQGSLVHIRGSEDVFQYFRTMGGLPKEYLRMALINSRYQLIHEETLAIGSIDYIHLHPRDIFQAAVERRVTAIVLVHNHPSGDPTPSAADINFTLQIIEAGKILGIEVLDHVIIGTDRYASCVSVREV